jgi:tetratricopeptide (TPR) repeat protein
MRVWIVCALLLGIAPGCDEKKKDDASSDESASKKKKKKGADDDGDDKKKGECADEDEAKALVKKGYDAVHDNPPRGAEAFKAYTKAVKLMDGGCKLSEKDEWNALAGLGIAALLTKDYEAAKKPLERANKKWPGIGETHYNLACAHCLLDDVDACYDEYKKTLEVADKNDVPDFIKKGNDARHYVKAAQKDPDLALLRKDKRFEKLIAKYDDL